jgi:hypothetical protein
MRSHFGGRPRLPRSQVRDQRVVTFLTAGEFERLIQIAEHKGVSLSRVCHELIVSGLDAQLGRQLGRNTLEQKKT